MDKYTKVCTLGRGSYGKAVLVKSVADPRQQFVLKLVKLHRLSPEAATAARAEADILSKLSHANIIQYIESFETQGRLVIVMSYADAGDLQSRIDQAQEAGEHLSENEILGVLIQVALGLKYCHDVGVLHRDLKPQNVFLTQDGVVKLGDFGVARELDHTAAVAQTAIGTPYFISPEIASGECYGRPADIWALGVTLYTMMALKPPFSGSNLAALVARILRGIYAPLPAMYSPELKELCKSMLAQSPNDRPSISDVLRAPFIRARLKALAASLAQPLSSSVATPPPAHMPAHGVPCDSDSSASSLCEESASSGAGELSSEDDGAAWSDGSGAPAPLRPSDSKDASFASPGGPIITPTLVSPSPGPLRAASGPSRGSQDDYATWLAREYTERAAAAQATKQRAQADEIAVREQARQARAQARAAQLAARRREQELARQRAASSPGSDTRAGSAVSQVDAAAAAAAEWRRNREAAARNRARVEAQMGGAVGRGPMVFSAAPSSVRGGPSDAGSCDDDASTVSTRDAVLAARADKFAAARAANELALKEASAAAVAERKALAARLANAEGSGSVGAALAAARADVATAEAGSAGAPATEPRVAPAAFVVDMTSSPTRRKSLQPPPRLLARLEQNRAKTKSTTSTAPKSEPSDPRLESGPTKQPRVRPARREAKPGAKTAAPKAERKRRSKPSRREDDGVLLDIAASVAVDDPSSTSPRATARGAGGPVLRSQASTARADMLADVQAVLASEAGDHASDDDEVVPVFKPLRLSLDLSDMMSPHADGTGAAQPAPDVEHVWQRTAEKMGAAQVESALAAMSGKPVSDRKAAAVAAVGQAAVQAHWEDLALLAQAEAGAT